MEVVRCALAWPIPGLTDPSAPVLDLLALVLGGGDSSVLWLDVREKRKLVHTIDASSWNPGSSGLFCISFTCDAGKREAAEAAIMRVLAAHAAPGAFKAAQVRKAYRQSVVSEINTLKTVSGQASRLGTAEVVVGDLEFGRTYFEQLARVKARDLSNALRAHLVPGRLTSVSLEPEGCKSSAGPGSAAPAGRPDFEEIRLPNGARIVFQLDRRLPNLHMRLLTHGGPSSEAQDRRGSSTLLATLLTKDTGRRSAAEVARRIEEVGGSFTSYSGDNTIGLAAEVLPADADRALGLIAEGVLTPAFREGTLATERSAQLAMLREEKDDVVSCARRMLRARFFGSDPFALSALGDEGGVSATGSRDVAALWKRLLVGPGVVLSVAGDFTPKRLLPRIEEFLLRIPRGQALKAGPLFDGPAEAGEFLERQPREQAVVMEGFPGAVLDAPDYYAGEVIDELFSGMALDLRLPVRAAFDLVTKLLQPRRQFRAIHRRRVLLRSVKFLRLQRPRLTLSRLSHIEDHRVRVQLRRCITVNRSAAVVLELGDGPHASGLRRDIAAHARLRVLLHLIKCRAHALSMRVSHAVVAANQRGQRYALRRAERRIPSGPVLHRAYRLTAGIDVLARCLMPYQLLARLRVLALGQPRELLLLNLSLQAPASGKLASNTDE